MEKITNMLMWVTFVGRPSLIEAFRQYHHDAVSFRDVRFTSSYTTNAEIHGLESHMKTSLDICERFAKARRSSCIQMIRNI